jgi:hypothetical protein
LPQRRISANFAAGKTRRKPVLSGKSGPRLGDQIPAKVGETGRRRGLYGQVPGTDQKVGFEQFQLEEIR